MSRPHTHKVRKVLKQIKGANNSRIVAKPKTKVQENTLNKIKRRLTSIKNERKKTLEQKIKQEKEESELLDNLLKVKQQKNHEKETRNEELLQLQSRQGHRLLFWCFLFSWFHRRNSLLYFNSWWFLARSIGIFESVSMASFFSI